MRKSAFFLAIFTLLMILSGCQDSEENTYSFYYVRTADSIMFGQSDALIAPVNRTFSGQHSDLSYLLQHYFEGPAEEGFESPFPQGTRLIRVRMDGNLLIAEVTTHFLALENIRLTTEGACLTATCHELTGAESVQVVCGNEIFQFNRSDYIFLDVIDTQSGKDTQ